MYGWFINSFQWSNTFERFLTNSLILSVSQKNKIYTSQEETDESIVLIKALPGLLSLTKTKNWHFIDIDIYESN